MFIKKIITLLGFFLLLTGCASDRYLGNADGADGKPETPLSMGKRYLLGRGVPQSDVKAFDYFRKAADGGSVFAQNEVAYMYAAGKGTDQDYTKAVYYYQKAANQGLASAQFNLGILYKNGLGVAANPSLATYWFEKSASHGFEPAKRALAHPSS